MDETRGIIRRGCNLARQLEENLDNVANQPELVFRYCDEIIRVFGHIKERISHSKMVLDVGHDPRELPVQQQMEVPSGVQEWLNSQPTFDQLLRAQAQLLGSGGAFGSHGGALTEPAAGGKMKEIDQQEQVVGGLSAMVAEFPTPFGDDLRPMEVSNASRGSSSVQRQRRRRDDGEKRTVTVPAPRFGNTEIPPDDEYTWRKYGQKDILNSKFPRSYFRCTHQKLYNCPAKKQVQRLDDDPNKFEVTYRGEHTCHLSSTAPSAPPTSLRLRQDVIPQAAAIIHPPPPPPPGPSNSSPVSHWLSMDIISPPVGEGTSSLTAGMQMYRGFSLATTGTSNSGAGPSSAAAAARLRDYQPVADMADVMFNSGSSSNNSMDLIFPSMDDKWDSGENKN